MGPRSIIRYLVFTIVLIFNVSFGCNALALGSLEVSYIKPGSEGEDVKLVQETLRELSLYNSDITGFYDKHTAKAVKKLQEQLAVKADGIFGPKTLAAYNQAYSSGIFETQTSESVESDHDEELPLKGIVIGIDPGHQLKPDYGLELLSPDSDKTKVRMSKGAKGIKTGIEECRINLQVSLKLRELLEESGATVIMTRTKNDVSISNMERAVLMNESNVDVWIRIHCDYSASSKSVGASILLPSRRTSPDIYKASLKLGISVLEAFCAETGSHVRAISQRTDQTAFNWSKAPVFVLEMGYLSNPAQDIKLNTAKYQEACAKSICKGFIDYFAQVRD